MDVFDVVAAGLVPALDKIPRTVSLASSNQLRPLDSDDVIFKLAVSTSLNVTIPRPPPASLSLSLPRRSSTTTTTTHSGSSGLAAEHNHSCSSGSASSSSSSSGSSSSSSSGRSGSSATSSSSSSSASSSAVLPLVLTTIVFEYWMQPLLIGEYYYETCHDWKAATYWWSRALEEEEEGKKENRGRDRDCDRDRDRSRDRAHTRYRLGQVLLWGMRVVPVNRNEALVLLNEAITTDTNHQEARSLLATCHTIGHFVRRDSRIAAELFATGDDLYAKCRRARDDDHIWDEILRLARTDKHRNLRALFEAGRRSCGRSYDGLTWYQAAAHLGMAWAQATLGDVLCKRRRYGEAAPWLTEAAAQGCVESMILLASLYAQGQGMKRSNRRAVALWKHVLKLAAQHCIDLEDQCVAQLIYNIQRVEPHIQPGED